MILYVCVCVCICMCLYGYIVFINVSWSVNPLLSGLLPSLSIDIDINIRLLSLLVGHSLHRFLRTLTSLDNQIHLIKNSQHRNTHTDYNQR